MKLNLQTKYSSLQWNHVNWQLPVLHSSSCNLKVYPDKTSVPSSLSETVNLIPDQQSQSDLALFVLFQNTTPPTFFHVKITSAFCDVFYPKVSGARGKTRDHALMYKSNKITE